MPTFALIPTWLGSSPQLQNIGVVVAVLIPSVIILYVISARYFTPLRKIPGPFSASISSLWIVRQQLGLKRPLVDLALHKKYGPVVRVAPNEVLISTPSAKKQIYGALSKFPKGAWYLATGDCGWSGPDRLDFLPEMDMEKYRIQRRLIGPAYTASYMREVEPHLDNVMSKDLSAMMKRSGMSVDADTFFSWWSSDCIQAATYGHSRGYVEHNAEDGAIEWVHGLWHYMHWVGYLPILHRIRLYYINLVEEPYVEPFMGWWSKQMKNLPFSHQKKSAQVEEGAKGQETKNLFQQSIFGWAKSELQARVDAKELPTSPTTIADRLLQIQRERPGLKSGWIKDACVQNFNAGVETIGITIGVFVNFMISHPECAAKVQEELNQARAAGRLSAVPKLSEVGRETLPYLSACMSESRRLHPPLAHGLARVVPDGGMEVEGFFLPAGTTVGINPWVLGRDRSLYGQDAEVFRPERWLEYSDEQLKVLDGYSMFFGTGTRSCPGQYLAEAIYSKAIPLLLMNLKFSYTDPAKPKGIQSTFMTRLDAVMMEWQCRKDGQNEKSVTWAM